MDPQVSVKKSVGVVLFATAPDGGKSAAICSIRPLFKKKDEPEGGLKSESFAKGSQVFSHGGLDKLEATMPGLDGYIAGLRRELTEEMGPALATIVMDNLVRDDSGSPKVVGYKKQAGTPEKPGKEVFTFCAHIAMPLSQLRELAVPTEEVYGIRAIPVDKLDVMKPYAPQHKNTPVPVGEVRLHDDEIAAHAKGKEIVFGVNPKK